MSDKHEIKELIPIDFIEEGLSNKTFSNDEQSKKRRSSILVTDEGIVICSNEEHERKAAIPIEVTDEGIVIRSNEEHSIKAASSIDLMHEDTIETSVIDVQFLKASFSIDVIRD